MTYNVFSGTLNPTQSICKNLDMSVNLSEKYEGVDQESGKCEGKILSGRTVCCYVHVWSTPVFSRLCELSGVPA